MIILLLYILSGMAALVLEAVLLRQLSWMAGSATAVTALVLAAFLGGLALGAAWLGPRADRVNRPLRMYGALEIGAGLSSLLVLQLLGPWNAVALAPLRALAAAGLDKPAGFALAVVVLLLPTTLLGGTFPAIARHLAARRGDLLGRVSLIYGLNTLGGAAGVLLAGFFLFEQIGILASGRVAAGTALLIGVAALALDRRAGSDAASASPAQGSSAADATPVEPAMTATPRLPLLIATGLGGGALLGCEVAWTRVLSLPMRSWSYSFSLMLALFLIGLVVGALLLSLLSRFVRRPERWFAGACAASGVWIASTLLWLPDVLEPKRASGFFNFLLGGAWRASPVVLIPTALSGMALPLAIRTLHREGQLGREAGRVYAANTVGSIAGALLGGLVLLPQLGLSRTLALCATVVALAGALVATSSLRSVAPKLAAWTAVVIAGSSLLLSPERFVRPFVDAPSGSRDTAGEILRFDEGATDTVVVVKRDYGFFDPTAKSLLTNGIAMTATTLPVRRYMAAEGHLPVLLAEDPKRALVICIGTGITLSAVTSHPELEHIDAVELSRGVLDSLDLFVDEHRGAHHDPRVDLRRDDGRHVLAMARDDWDVITLEPPPPIVAGAVHLYSSDFYELVRSRLADGGVVAQWLPLHGQSLESARMLARTFNDAFEHVQLWLPSTRDAVLLGSRRPLTADVARFNRAWQNASTRESLDAAGLETAPALLATFLLDGPGIARWTDGALPITDDRPRMEYFRHQGSNMKDHDMAGLLAVPAAPLSEIGDFDAGQTALLERERQALITHVRAAVDGDDGLAVEAARQSSMTAYFRHRFGCSDAQLAYLREHPDSGPPFDQQLARCRGLMTPAGATGP